MDMKYYKFDYEALLRDYKYNRKSLNSLKKQIQMSEKGVVRDAESKGIDIYEYTLEPSHELQSLYDLKDEYQLYVDLVDDAFDALKEKERLALTYSYIDGQLPTAAARKMFVSLSTFYRVRAVAFDRFCKIVLPE